MVTFEHGSAKCSNLWFQFCINPSKSLDELFPGPIHARPPVLCTLKVGWQISIHVFAPEISRVWIWLLVLETITRQRRLPRSHRFEMSKRWIFHFGQIHGPGRFPLLVPWVSLIDGQSSILILIKIVKVILWQPSSLPVFQRYSSISVTDEIQLVVRSSKVWWIRSIPYVHGIYQVISIETTLSSCLQALLKTSLANCQRSPH